MKRLPAPSLLVTEISPPCWLASRCDRASPKPVPAKSWGDLVVDLDEWFEEPAQILGVDADAGVPHSDLHDILFPLGDDIYAHGAALRREFHGIAQQVDQDLFEAQRVDLDRPNAVVKVLGQAQPLLLGQLADDI